MEISKDQLQTIIHIAMHVKDYNYPAIANAIDAISLPEEVAMMIATAASDCEEW